MFNAGLLFFSGIFAYIVFSRLLKIKTGLNLIDEGLAASIALYSLAIKQQGQILEAVGVPPEKIEKEVDLIAQASYNKIQAKLPRTYKSVYKFNNWDDLVSWFNKHAKVK